MSAVITVTLLLLLAATTLDAGRPKHTYLRGGFGGVGPAPNPQCHYNHNYDIVGDEFQTLPAADVGACCDLCIANPLCVASVFDVGECDLHSSRRGLTPSLGPVAAIVTSRAPPTPSPTIIPTDTPTPEPTKAPMPPGPLPCIGFDPYVPPQGAPPLNNPSGNGGCACGEGDCVNVTPTFNWIFTACKSPSPLCQDKPSDDGCACASTNMLGPSIVNMNYVAAYQLAPVEGGAWGWEFAPQSSLNLQWNPALNAYTRTNNTQLVFNSAMKRNDFNKLPTEKEIYYGDYPMNERVVNSMSGGGGAWDIALFPYNTTGLKPPGMMFVFSGRLQGAAWFILNQATLNRGPNKPTCTSEFNCWSTGSAGEIDFLEFPNLFGGQKHADTESVKKMWATSYNGAGRCFNQNIGQGAYCHPDGFCGANSLPVGSGPNRSYYTNYFSQGGGGPYSLYSYNYDDGEEHLWVAVVDFRGTTLYKDPNFPGLTPYSAAAQLTQLAPTVDSAYTTGACGDPTIYNEEQMELPCVIYLASAPLFITEAQWTSAIQLVPPEQRDARRYLYPGAETIANFWKTGALQCGSEVWWNLFIDTLQLVAPPSIYGMIYTSAIETMTSQPIIVPGVNLRPWDSTSKWQPAIAQRSGGYHSVTRGSLDTTCIPGRGQNLLNCPYNTQSMWHPAVIRMAPQGTNADLCGGSAPGGCCLDCTMDTYLNVTMANMCPNPCTPDQFIDAIQLPGHNGCAPTMPACPHADQAAQCGNMGPYSYPPPNPALGSNQCIVPGFPCNMTMCTTVVGPLNFPFPKI